MKTFAKYALGALMVAGAATATTVAADSARRSARVGRHRLRRPGLLWRLLWPALCGYYGPAYYDPYYGPAYYDPYYYGGYGYYGPSFYFGGGRGWGGGYRGGYRGGYWRRSLRWRRLPRRRRTSPLGASL